MRLDGRKGEFFQTGMSIKKITDLLNTRSFRINSQLSLKEGGALTLVIMLISSLFLSLTTTCREVHRGAIVEEGTNPATESGGQTEPSGRLIAVWSRSWYTEMAQVSPPDFDDWRKQNKVFDHMAAFVGGGLKLTKGGRSEEIPRTSVSSGFFEVLGAKPFLGRVITLADEASGRDDIVILSHALWQRHFDSDPNIIGKKVSFNSEDFTVVGVMPKGFENPGKSDLPPDFRYQSRPEVWTPLAINSMQVGRGFRILSVIARLRPGVTLSEARTEMEAIANNLQQRNPQTNKGWGVYLVVLQ